MSNEPSFNSRSNQKNSKAFFIKKIDVNNCKEIKNNIKNYFFNPDTYFSNDSPIQVGKKQEITEISSIKYRKQKKTTIINNNTSSSKTKSYLIKTEKEKEKERNQIIDKNKYEILDNNKLKYIFDSFKNRINSKKKEAYLKYNNSDLPSNMNMSLRNQQESIHKAKLNKISTDNLERYLSKKSNKTKDDLIFNKIDNYLYKKEIIN